jgi:hypothetical protein
MANNMFTAVNQTVVKTLGMADRAVNILDASLEVVELNVVAYRDSEVLRLKAEAAEEAANMAKLLSEKS